MPPHIDAYLYYVIWKNQFCQVGMFYHTNCASYIRHTYLLIKSQTDSSPGHMSFSSYLREWTWRVQTQLQNELRPVSVIWWMINMMANNIKKSLVWNRLSFIHLEKKGMWFNCIQIELCANKRRNQFHWFWHVTRTPPRCFLNELFWVYPTGRRPRVTHEKCQVVRFSSVPD